MIANLPATTLSALLGTALLTALPLAATGPQEDADEPAALGLLPTAITAIDLPAGRDLSLADLVDALGESTGLRFVVSSSTRQYLNDTPAGLLAGGAVQPDEVYAFAESVFKRHRIVMERLGGEDFPVAALYWLDGGRDSNAIGWSTIKSDDAAVLADHAALLVQCSLDVSPTDARHLANAGRSLMRDTQFQNVVPLNESTLILRGTGADVADLVAMFSEAAANEAALEEARSAASEETQEAGGQQGGR